MDELTPKEEHDETPPQPEEAPVAGPAPLFTGEGVAPETPAAEPAPVDYTPPVEAPPAVEEAELVTLELVAGFREWQELSRSTTQCFLNQGSWHQAVRPEHEALLDDIA